MAAPFEVRDASLSALEVQILEILRLDPARPGRLVSRESTRLEYKQSFNWGNRAKYAKTMAAFANTSGGFIVFGIKDSPREVQGLHNRRFDDFDPAKLSEYLNSTFSPEIRWEKFTVELAGRRVGVIATLAAMRRPVICTRNEGDVLHESSIYYRYAGRSERIKYPELEALLSERERDEREAWLRHLSRIAKVGIENVGLLDLTDGELVGAQGRVLIAADLLEKVQFIREGRFAETDEDGAPTLRVIGEVEPVVPESIRPLQRVELPKVLSQRELMRAFLLQKRVAHPEAWIEHACREQTPHLPVFYFAWLAGLDVEALEALIEAVEDKGPGCRQLLERVRGKRIAAQGKLDGSTPSAVQRRAVDAALQRKDAKALEALPVRRVLEVVTHYGDDRVTGFLLEYLACVVDNEFESLSDSLRTDLRRAIAHLDDVMFRDKVPSSSLADVSPVVRSANDDVEDEDFWTEPGVDELARRQGIVPDRQLDAVLGAGAELWDSAEEFDAFVENIHERRRRDREQEGTGS